MPIVSGEITKDGAVIVALVGVGSTRRRRLESVGLPVPEPVPVRVQIDPGSYYTAFMPEVFRALQIKPFSSARIRTPSTRRGESCECPMYDATLTLVSGLVKETLPSAAVIESEDFMPEEEVQAIIGRDLLQHCVFTYYGPSRSFELAFSG